GCDVLHRLQSSRNAYRRACDKRLAGLRRRNRSLKCRERLEGRAERLVKVTRSVLRIGLQARMKVEERARLPYLLHGLGGGERIGSHCRLRYGRLHSAWHA